MVSACGPQGTCQCWLCVELESRDMSRLLRGSGLGGLAVAHQEGQTVL